MKLRNLTSFALICLLTIPTLKAQWKDKKVVGNGNIVTKTVNTGDYDEVQLVGSMNVELVKGNEGSISLTTDENLHEYVEIKSEGKDLVIKTKKNYNLKTKKGILVTVPFTDLNAVKMVGSGDVTGKDVIKSATMEVSLTGSGDILLDLDAEMVEAKVTGSGDVLLKGKTNFLEVKLTGSGDFNGEDLEANNTEVAVSGSGDAKVIARGSLKARVSGSGEIKYKGNPEKRDTKTSGSGEIRSLQ